ncbi:MAG: polysaccharide biosynthesis protein, partial [Chromatiales bacterium]|nr:polysaccharide biosynthesis protein [Chromatiales bacterium]
ERELQALASQQGKPPKLIALLGNVQDQILMRQYMQHFRIQTIYHAAAYKHVPMVEHNIAQGIRNNILGTLALARASIETGVETFVLISTDKAVRPTNVMGATKRFAELILQALSQQQIQTRFCMVRFGNVLGSSGSVVPVFREQIKNAGPVTVTHPDIVRYFMTIPEAALLVIQAGSMGTGGDVFVLDMGKPVKIADLAKKMIGLSGKTVRSDDNPRGDIAIEYTGLRPGEKLYEELLIGDNVTGTEHAMIMRAEEHAYTWSEMESALQQLDQALQDNNIPELREILIRTIQGYTPSSPIVDHYASREKAELLSNPAIH